MYIRRILKSIWNLLCKTVFFPKIPEKITNHCTYLGFIFKISPKVGLLPPSSSLLLSTITCPYCKFPGLSETILTKSSKRSCGIGFFVVSSGCRTSLAFASWKPVAIMPALWLPALPPAALPGRGCVVWGVDVSLEPE